MGWFYRQLIRPVLFTQAPESIHNRTIHGLGWMSRHSLLCDALETFLGAPELPIDLFGLRFPNPIGLAAGMDKDAEALPAWAALGFGFTELGAVTRHPQPGNPAPRVFRIIPDEAIINRMGFNNAGADAVAEKLAEWRRNGRWPNHPVGMNLGKSRITELAEAPADYAYSFACLLPHLDFFVVNVSSPNTPNLRKLQDRAALDEILAALQAVRLPSAPNVGQTSRPGFAKPVLVKVAPDLSFEALDEIVELALSRGIAGLVATNTTIARPENPRVELKQVYGEAGGLSGRPLASRSTQIIRHLYRQAGGRLPIIGVGGIFSAADAWEKLTAGASLLQVYTGLIYEGPAVARAIIAGLMDQLEQAGLRELREVIGSAA